MSNSSVPDSVRLLVPSKTLSLGQPAPLKYSQRSGGSSAEETWLPRGSGSTLPEKALGGVAMKRVAASPGGAAVSPTENAGSASAYTSSPGAATERNGTIEPLSSGGVWSRSVNPSWVTTVEIGRAH